MRHELITKVEARQLKTDLPVIKVGNQVAVHTKVREGNKQRTQIFQGLVIAQSGTGLTKTIRVRKVTLGIGVERVFLVHSPNITEIQVLRHHKVRRAKLYYLRGRTGRAARLKTVGKK